MSARTIIENTDKFSVVSIGNGAAYELTDKATGETKFVAYGDDATKWRECYDAMVICYGVPGNVWRQSTWDECLAYLIHDCA